MKIASWSLFVLVLASLTSWESHAQREGRPRPERPETRPTQTPVPVPVPVPLPHYEDRFPQEEILSERIQQTIGRGQRLRLSSLLRSYDLRAEVLSLSITAQSFNGPATLQLLSGYTTLETLPVRRQLQKIPVRAIQLGSLDLLELSSFDDVYIESITATVRSSRPDPRPQPIPEMQVSPYSLITVRLNQDVMSGEIPLKRLIREQLGLSIEGAQIERVAVEGMPLGRVASSVHVEINNRIASDVKYLSGAQRRLPLQIRSLEEVRNISLVVSGPARIMDINIRIGAVRPVYHPIPVPVPLPLPSTIFVNQEVSPSYPLDLALHTRELSPVRSLRIETNLRSRIAANLTVINRYGQTVGRAMISSGVTHIVITAPSALADLRIFTDIPVLVGTIEAELDRPYGRY